MKKLLPGIFSFFFFAIYLSGQESFDVELDSTRRWSWDNNLSWEFEARSLLTRDALGNVIEVHSSIPEGDQWIITGISTYLYNAENQLIEFKIDFNNNLSWVNWLRNLYAYDGFGNQIETISQHWINNNWDNSWRVTSTYDSNLKILASIEAKWDTTEWIDKTWNEFTYTDEGLVQYQTIREHIGGSIYKDYRFEYTYDAEDRLYKVAFQNPLGGGLWDDLSYDLYTYQDSTITITEKRYTQFGFENWERTIFTYNSDDKLLSTVRADWNNGWENYDSLRYYYSPQTIPVQNINVLPISIYPNPASSTIYMDIGDPVIDATVTIYTYTGELIQNRRLYGGTNMQIEIGNLPAGEYYLLLNSEGRFYRGKIIKQ